MSGEVIVNERRVVVSVVDDRPVVHVVSPRTAVSVVDGRPVVQVVEAQPVAGSAVDGRPVVHVVASPKVVQIASRPGEQGPPGPPGTAGTGSTSVGAVNTYAGEAIGGHRVVRLVDGVARIASSAVTAHAQAMLGVTLHAAALGAPLAVALTGVVTESSWAWTSGASVFLGVDGSLTQTLPAGPLIRRVGAAISPTSIVLGEALTIQTGG